MRVGFDVEIIEEQLDFHFVHYLIFQFSKFTAK
jgi:hypothetical protein